MSWEWVILILGIIWAIVAITLIAAWANREKIKRDEKYGL